MTAHVRLFFANTWSGTAPPEMLTAVGAVTVGSPEAGTAWWRLLWPQHRTPWLALIAQP